MKLGILRRILALILILISIFYFSGVAKFYRYKKDNEVFLYGESLVQFYNRKIESDIKKSNLVIQDLFKLAESAYYKKSGRRTHKEEAALFIVRSASFNFFRIAFNDSLVFESGEIPILIFGGIMDVGSSFLKKILEETVLVFKNSQKRLNLVFSKMGDERAVLGAVAYIAPIFNCKGNNDYAIGIDIGGTNIRSGIIKLNNFSLEKKITKEPVFINESDRNVMNCLIPGLKKLAKSMKKHNYSNELDENNSELLRKQKVIRSALIKRLCDMINTAKKNYKIKFIAISSAGNVNEDGFFDYVCKLPFTGINLKCEMESILNIPVFVANDINCAAFGEKQFGSLKKYNKFIVAGLGTGLGIKYFKFNSNSIMVQDLFKKNKNEIIGMLF